MAVSVIYLDAHGQRVAERVSDITYKSADLGYLCVANKYWFMNFSEDNIMFECGSDKRGFRKFPDWEKLITFYLRFRGFKKSGWYSPYYPERNTIYISPEENGHTQAEYYSLCYRQAEEKIRALAKLASDGANGFVPISFLDFWQCFSDAYFVDAFTIEKADISHFADAVDETLARLNEKLSGSENYYNVLVYFRLPDDINAGDVNGAMCAIKNLAANLKIGMGFNEENVINITAGISYRCHKLGANR